MKSVNVVKSTRRGCLVLAVDEGHGNYFVIYNPSFTSADFGAVGSTVPAEKFGPTYAAKPEDFEVAGELDTLLAAAGYQQDEEEDPIDSPTLATLQPGSAGALAVTADEIVEDEPEEK